MLVLNNKKYSKLQKDEKIFTYIHNIQADNLKTIVETIAIPRHYIFHTNNNKWVGNFIFEKFQSFDLKTFYQGKYNNIVASSLNNPLEAKILIGAHYDSVLNSPGADDNGSAIAALLESARIISQLDLPVVFVAFNREEENLLGSYDFIENYFKNSQIQCAHILEMLGYCDKTKGSQTLPAGLPINIGDIGDFIAIISNYSSNKQVSFLLDSAVNYSPDLAIKVLKIFFKLERYFGDLLRSDHTPFWQANLPAFMWTDTANFRNPHYHKPSDLPETINYHFLTQVTQLLTAHTIGFCNEI